MKVQDLEHVGMAKVIALQRNWNLLQFSFTYNSDFFPLFHTHSTARYQIFTAQFQISVVEHACHSGDYQLK